MRHLKIISVLFGLAILAAACAGSGDDDAAPSTTGDTAEDTVTSTTSEPTTSTTEATTTSTEPVDSDEAAVLAIVDRFFGDLRDQPDPTKPIDSYPDVASEILIDPLLSIWKQHDADSIALGRTTESYPALYHLTDISITDDTAVVTACHLGRGAGIGPDGEVVVPSAGKFDYAEVFLTRQDDQWWVNRWQDPFDGDANLCDPVELWGDLDDVGDPDVIAEVNSRFLKYMESVWVFDEREQDVAEMQEPINEYATRTERYWLTRLFDEQATQAAETNLVIHGWDMRIESTKVEGNSAQILACGITNAEYLSVDDGSVLFAENDSMIEMAYMLKEPDGQWRVEFFAKGSDQTCE